MALVSWLLSRRKAPSPNENKLHLTFHVEKPTTLESFNGADATLVVELKGRGAEKSRFQMEDPLLEVQDKRRVLKSLGSRGYSGFWAQVWKSSSSSQNNVRYPVNTQKIPPGKLRFGFKAHIAPSFGLSATAAKMPYLSGRWPINRALIKPLPFKKMARVPLVVLHQVKITRVFPSGHVSGECVFNLMGAGMNARTSVEYNFSGYGTGKPGSSIMVGIGWGMGGVTRGTGRQRVPQWDIYAMAPRGVTIGHLSGRVSADNRWPLAFQIEPFDLAKAKVGQKLKFKSWPAPVPKS